ncbi:hypothetical protein ScalyP_jg10282 [Parmales sp. scaly parma]|nr:hypothetical protein ScalyP_jg10282 [Parmales sp. scaly parma]
MNKSIIPLSLTNMQTAAPANLEQICSNHDNVIIDLWTTSCTRCPAALDTLTSLTSDPAFADFKFVAINCGNDTQQCDDAREILEATPAPRWSTIDHYYAPLLEKEKAKAFFGFSQVPFYILVVQNKIVHMGSKKSFDLQSIPVRVRDINNNIAGADLQRTPSPTNVTAADHAFKAIRGDSTDSEGVEADVESVGVVKMVDPVEPTEFSNFVFSLDEEF